MSFFWFTVYLSIASVLLPLSLAIPQWKKMPQEIASLRWLLVAGLTLDVTGLTLALSGINNLGVGDLFMFIQFTTLLYIFALQFESRIAFKIAYATITIAYLTGYAIYFITKNKPVLDFVGSNVVDSLTLITVSIIFFYKLLNELKVINIHRLAILWIAFAVLFYYSGNLFVFMASSYLEKQSFTLTWELHNFLNTIKNILFAVALWQSYRTLKTSNG